MPKIIAYRVVFQSSVKDLTTAVERLMGEGWQPFGGVGASPAGLAQALVKYEG
jgi:hypothetical protein